MDQPSSPPLPALRISYWPRGVRVVGYVGALAELGAAGFTWQSISACSAGTFVVSYAREDRAWIERLQTFLKPYMRSARMEVWRNDTRIAAVSHCAWQTTPIRDYQSANDPQRPLDTLSEAEQNRVLTNICERVKAALVS